VETTQPKPFVFVLMPFSNDFEDIYEVGIKPACIEAGSYCERVDEQIFDGSILDRVYNQINKADLLVADMTDRNPNVFYEVGYAHALGKRVILLTQRVEDIPFDLRPYPHIVYGDSITTLKAELVKRVSWFLQEGLTRASTTDDHSQFAYYLEGQRITEGARIKIAESSGHEGNWNDQFVFAVDLHVSVQNPNNKILTANFKYFLLKHIWTNQLRRSSRKPYLVICVVWFCVRLILSNMFHSSRLQASSEW
jgi:hypothetical protein